MSNDRRIGALIDAANVVADIDDDQHLVEVVVIAKLASFDSNDSRPRLLIAAGEGTDWIAEIGLLHAARALIDQPPDRESEDG